MQYLSMHLVSAATSQNYVYVQIKNTTSKQFVCARFVETLQYLLCIRHSFEDVHQRKFIGDRGR